MSLNLIKLFLPIILTFFVGMFITPLLTDFMYKYRLWKHSSRSDEKNVNKDNIGMSNAFQEINKKTKESEVSTPRVGGVVVWMSVILTSAFVFLIFILFPNDTTSKLEFISRNQTLLPFLALILGSLVGLADDLLVIFKKQGTFAHGLPRKYMISIVTLMGLVFGVWFFTKLGISSISIPFSELRLELGWFIIPFFVFVTLGTFSSGVIDGIDGLAGGVMASIFSAYSLIAYFQNQIDLSVFCAVIVAALLVFLWFNVPPARFYLGETGMLGLTLTLSVVVFLTDSVLLLLIIGFPLVITSLSSFLQIVSKKIRGPQGKIFKVAPLHHHFEAVGWSRPKITMRYWIISIFFGVTGVIISLL